MFIVENSHHIYIDIWIPEIDEIFTASKNKIFMKILMLLA